MLKIKYKIKIIFNINIYNFCVLIKSVIINKFKTIKKYVKFSYLFNFQQPSLLFHTF